ncbi:heme exporter protein CcmD [Deinococcus deserti]|nr:heme exporter protein CcmD [Deinococcus deserti]
MDKYSAYVVIVYTVTLALLVGYLLWIWWRLKSMRNEGSEGERQS